MSREKDSGAKGRDPGLFRGAFLEKEEVALGCVGEEEVADAREGDVGLQRSPSWRDEGRRGSRSVRVSSAKER